MSAGIALARRHVALRAPEYLWPVASLVASLVIVAPLVALAGADPWEGYSTLWEASFGPGGFGVLLTYSVPLVLVGLGVALPLRIGLFNIGGEGQLLLGAFAAVVVGVKLTGPADVPASFVLPLAAAAIGGALLGAIAGALKAWRNINEIITTIMLTSIAGLFVQYWVSGPFQDEQLSYSASPAVLDGYRLALVGGDAAIPTSIFVVLGVTGIVATGVHLSRVGWRMYLAGTSPALAMRQGVHVRRLQFAAMAAGGALAGIGGGAEALGNQYRVGEEFSPGWGFDAVAIAILARGNMLAVVPYALFFGFLRNGAGLLQTNLAVPGAIVVMLAGAPIIVVAGALGIRQYRRRGVA